MSIIPTSGIVVSAAGIGLAQTGGLDAIRAQQAATAQQRHAESALRAEDTAGIAATDGEDQETNDRDADGRRQWEFSGAQQHQSADQDAADSNVPHLPKDPSGESGNELDLSG
jgi:hypothetical protein